MEDEFVDVLVEEEEEPAQDQKPPPEMEEEFVEDQYQFASSSWLQVHLDQDDVGDDKEEENVAVNSDSHSQATALILGEHLREENDDPMPPIAENENDEDPGQDSLVDKVMDELEAVNLDTKSKPATTPVPGKPFLEREEELGTAMGSTGPEGRVPRGQNKIGATVLKPETEEEALLRTLRSRLPASTRTVSQIKLKSLSNRARMPKPVPEGEVFDPKHNNRQFNSKTATVITQDAWRSTKSRPENANSTA